VIGLLQLGDLGAQFSVGHGQWRPR
jgi:hypothetical protein